MATHTTKGDTHTINDVLIEIEESNIPFSNPVPVFIKGISDQPIVASATIKRSVDRLLASIKFLGIPDKTLTPAIKVQVTKKEFDLSGKETSREGKIVGIELNPKPNVDPRIKSLTEQIKG